LTDAFAELGRVGEPILTAIKNGVAKMVSAAVPKLESFIQKVKDAKKWLKDNKDTVDKWEAAIVGATVSVGSFLLILKWGAIMGAAKTAIMGVRTAVLLLNAAMKANVIGLIVSLILGLVAAFVYLWKENDKFRAFWINLWNKIRAFVPFVPIRTCFGNSFVEFVPNQRHGALFLARFSRFRSRRAHQDDFGECYSCFCSS
jgi:phage-related protein